MGGQLLEGRGGWRRFKFLKRGAWGAVFFLGGSIL